MKYDVDYDGDLDFSYEINSLSTDSEDVEEWSSVILAGYSNYATEPTIDGLWMRDCFGIRELGYDDSWNFRNIGYG